MLLEHERNYGLGMDALVTVCCPSKNVRFAGRKSHPMAAAAATTTTTTTATTTTTTTTTTMTTIFFYKKGYWDNDIVNLRSSCCFYP